MPLATLLAEQLPGSPVEGVHLELVTACRSWPPSPTTTDSTLGPPQAGISRPLQAVPALGFMLAATHQEPGCASLVKGDMGTEIRPPDPRLQSRDTNQGWPHPLRTEHYFLRVPQLIPQLPATA